MKIGIAGGSCSGKTTLSKLLAEETHSRIISLDDYFNDPADFPMIYGRPDYDRYEAVDWERAVSDVSTCDEPLIVEGFLLLLNPTLRQVLDLTVYIDTPEYIRTERRLQRDNKNDNDRSYILHHIPRQHNALVEPSRELADITLNGTSSAEKMMRRLMEAVHRDAASSRFNKSSAMVMARPI